jgi:3-phosphoshikimate 1-carboxyvinyltransferase
MQQAVHMVRGPIHASITVPGSKSITNRALLLAALANGASEISGILLSDDTFAFIHALKQLGIIAQVDESARTCIIGGCDGKFPKKQAVVNCEDAGTVARFLLAACAMTPGVYQFKGTQRLCERPLQPLLNVLKQQGAQLIPMDTERLPLTLIGIDRMNGGDVTLDGKISSQFISGLLMMAPYARSPFNFTVRDLVSQPYVDMTCKMMSEFGVTVHRNHQGHFLVPVPQRYHPRDYTVEPDFSTASYFFAAAAVTGGEIEIHGMNRTTSKQADAMFLAVLEKMGCHVTETQNSLILKGPAELRGVDVNMQDYSDTFLTLAAIAPFAKTPTRITHIGHTRLKESDRITAVQSELQKMQINVESGEDWIQIFPGKPRGCLINSHQDHRIAMAFSVIGLKTPNVTIDQAECVTKTCPEFFTLWSQLTEVANII